MREREYAVSGSQNVRERERESMLSLEVKMEGMREEGYALSGSQNGENERESKRICCHCK